MNDARNPRAELGFIGSMFELRKSVCCGDLWVDVVCARVLSILTSEP